MTGCGDHSTTSAHTTEATAFLVPSELKSLGLGSYDDAIKQISNIGMVVAIVWVVLAAIEYVMPEILTDFMNNKVRTSMLAAVVLPILMQQVRNAVTQGVDMKVGRNLAVAAILAYVLLFQSAQNLIGPRLFDSPMDMVGMGSTSGMMPGPRRLSPAIPVEMPAMGSTSGYMRRY